MTVKLGWMVPLFGVALSLSSCDGFGPQTPLSHALTALRDGDRDSFLRAKEDAIAAEKTASKVGSNTCGLLTSDYFLKRGEASTVRKLDKPKLFTLAEDERLVFAINVAGPGAFVDLDDPDAQAILNPTDSTCPPMDSAQKSKAQASTEMYRSADIARRRMLKSWAAAVSRKYGEDQFEAQMRKAASHLTSTGLTARWPVSGADIGNRPPPSQFNEAARAVEESRSR